MEKPFSGSQFPYLQKEKLILDFQKMLFQLTLLIFITAATPVKGHIDTSDPGEWQGLPRVRLKETAKPSLGPRTEY